MTELEKILRKQSLYETFRTEIEAAISAFNAGAITREEMLKRFTFANDRLDKGLKNKQ